MEMKTIISGSSVRGDSHNKSDVKCQDAFNCRASSDGQWKAIVVCDGAGSSARSDEGSRYFAENFSQSLLFLAEELESREFGNWVTDFILNQIIRIRSNMREQLKSDHLEEFHTTLVALLLGPSRKIGSRAGISIHVGDGAIVGGNFSVDGKQIFINEDYQIISPPENGEYSNETYFVTENRWIKHIRISPVEDKDWFALGTDGGISAIFKPDFTPYNELASIFELIRSKAQSDFSTSFEKILKDEEVSYRTDDDKTLVIIAPEILINDRDLSLPFTLLKMTSKTEENSKNNEFETLYDTSARKRDNKEIKKITIKKPKKKSKLNSKYIIYCMIAILIGSLILLVSKSEVTTKNVTTESKREKLDIQNSETK